MTADTPMPVLPSRAEGIAQLMEAGAARAVAGLPGIGVSDDTLFDLVRDCETAGLDLEAPCTSTDSSGDKIFSVSKRKIGEAIPAGGGTGKSETQGGTGKYAGITGSCTYKVETLSANRIVSISKCQWQKP